MKIEDAIGEVVRGKHPRSKHVRERLIEQFVICGFTKAEDFERADAPQRICRMRNFGRKKFEMLRRSLARRGVALGGWPYATPKRLPKSVIMERLWKAESTVQYWAKIAKTRGYL